MLCLSRRPNESIIATTPSGERVTVTILSVDGRKVSVGVDAPKATTIHRAEIQERIDAQGKEAAA